MLWIELSGRLTYRLRSLLMLLWAITYTTARRLFKGPLLKGWNQILEQSIFSMKMQFQHALDLPNIADGREYFDALVPKWPKVPDVQIEPANSAPVKGRWFAPAFAREDLTLLYFHGGGYALYSHGEDYLYPLIALAAQARTFVPDYRLAPEHPFPAQLEDAQIAYRWLLDSGIEPGRLVVAGASAGGNLALALLLSLRDSQAPLPALAICISPWTDMQNSGASMTQNEPYDYVRPLLVKGASWFCKDADPCNPLVSPIQVDLRGLPPIYVQAGGAEVLIDTIREFARRGKEQGSEVQLEVWDNMPHAFQLFGTFTPQGKEALERIGQVIRQYLPVQSGAGLQTEPHAA